MSRIVLAFRSFFAILFTGQLPGDIAQAFGFTQVKSPTPAAKPAAKPSPQANPSDGALQILGLLQRKGGATLTQIMPYASHCTSLA